MAAAVALSVAEVARRLHVSEAHVYRMARAGDLPGAARVGRVWRVDARRLDAALFGAPDADAPHKCCRAAPAGRHPHERTPLP